MKSSTVGLQCDIGPEPLTHPTDAGGLTVPVLPQYGANEPAPLDLPCVGVPMGRSKLDMRRDNGLDKLWGHYKTGKGQASCKY